MVMEKRANKVAEAINVGKQTLFYLIQRLKMPPIQFLLFEICEKTFHNSIIIGMTLFGKRLDHVKRIQFFSQIDRGKLSPCRSGTSRYEKHLCSRLHPGEYQGKEKNPAVC